MPPGGNARGPEGCRGTRAALSSRDREGGSGGEGGRRCRAEAQSPTPRPSPRPSAPCPTPAVPQACALDPMLDDSVMFARRLRGLGKPVTLRVVEDLPHGFLSLATLCRETRQAAAQCVERIRLILAQPAPPAAPPV